MVRGPHQRLRRAVAISRLDTHLPDYFVGCRLLAMTKGVWRKQFHAVYLRLRINIAGTNATKHRVMDIPPSFRTQRSEVRNLGRNTFLKA